MAPPVPRERPPHHGRSRGTAVRAAETGGMCACVDTYPSLRGGGATTSIRHSCRGVRGSVLSGVRALSDRPYRQLEFLGLGGIRKCMLPLQMVPAVRELGDA
ncbi:hypothetical protein NCCP1664_11860 [Zafaria cholistanensis]|uniref:Uncharacterized protein n=1 Tax=Zafaria cholistanensis TaxID=1682741 RepID=A0A5A7NPS2_9MICC|nr:hypothetical protein NCCP1664_11860 [Zafaria cholistanensis]